jgi:hypothetical protein
MRASSLGDHALIRLENTPYNKNNAAYALNIEYNAHNAFTLEAVTW